MEDPRLPARLEATALLRRVQAEGGFGTVIQKGEPDSGTLLVVLIEKGSNARVYERMPQIDGSRAWHCSKQAYGNTEAIDSYLARRADQDRDLWILELDIADGERFIR
ncbi:MAG: DUF1491 family protein [Novosphingobium sp.]